MQLTTARRIRSTPYSSRVQAGGVRGMTVYNHMQLPTQFRGSLKDDYDHLCQHVQVWDVSVQRQVQLAGPDANKLVQWMTPRDIRKAKQDQCFYLPLCDEKGCLMNDPIGIKIDESTWWLSIADSDVMLWAKGLAVGKGLEVEVTEAAIWPIAVQGPKAEALMGRTFGEDKIKQIRFFRYKRLLYQGHEFIVSRSGWSKQGGFEVYVDNPKLGQQLWDELFEKGADLQVGHGSPNLMERIEGGLLSFGNDIYFDTSPLECGLEKFCNLDSEIESMSLPALRKQRQNGIKRKLYGLFANVDDDISPATQVELLDGSGNVVGEVTSHVMCGKIEKAWIGIAMIHLSEAYTLAHLQVRLAETGKSINVTCCDLPFDFSKVS